MPKRSLHILLWSAEHQRYELSTGGNLQQCFPSHDEQNWLDWLGEQTSFAFHGQRGHLSVVKEVRARGGGYWYTYGTQQGGGQETLSWSDAEGDAGLPGRGGWFPRGSFSIASAPEQGSGRYGR